jgi:hypothetical protein
MYIYTKVLLKRKIIALLLSYYIKIKNEYREVSMKLLLLLLMTFQLFNGNKDFFFFFLFSKLFKNCTENSRV